MVDAVCVGITTDTLNMLHAPIPPIHVGATAPESFTVLQHRIVTAEEQTDALIQELEDLGFGIEDTGASKIGEHTSHRPVSPFHVRKAFGTENDVLWKNCESLVSRVCRLESVIQTMKLNIFRIQTAKELRPEHSVDRLAVMQEEHIQELKKMQREIMRFRQQLSEVSEEKEAAHEEIERLSAALEMATATKIWRSTPIHSARGCHVLSRATQPVNAEWGRPGYEIEKLHVSSDEEEVEGDDGVEVLKGKDAGAEAIALAR
ncbi:hypothetical protein scyTo_0010833 [Scyliorhinus torazame]|uniref:Uncharacterized protein n=1 Tax=Scyliorhinus torazame TaxID=75743 RepID=A0A401PC36_SCYTO|nr:hypothetical protein [Scyliorhinus torazame]